jgi:hypothetical protein
VRARPDLDATGTDLRAQRADLFHHHTATPTHLGAAVHR